MAHKTVLTLIGQMGAGKSTVAQRLAGRWAARGWDAVDLDEVIVLQAGAGSVSEIFAELGERAFRRLEAEALAAALAGDRLVIATGGGAPCQPAAMGRILAAGPCVWLHAPAEVLAQRALAAGGRPLLAELGVDEAVAFLEGQLQARRPCYEQATHVVDATPAPEAVADAIEALLPQQAR
ncbi:MAG: shikimate kinase [Proteobacteria bacterium]|nr:MAG: shikimate kinase [Pseudomonadota bacterium]